MGSNDWIPTLPAVSCAFPGGRTPRCSPGWLPPPRTPQKVPVARAGGAFWGSGGAVSPPGNSE
eukprot:105300-Alexandrium_andersonii.AAC.1